MKKFLEPYNFTLLMTSIMTLLLLVQAFVAATVKNVIQKKTPGLPGGTDHDEFVFRAERAFANTQENITPFILLVSLSIFVGVTPKWVNILAATFVGSRALHMIVYYADVRPVRTVVWLAGFGTMVGWGFLVLITLL